LKGKEIESHKLIKQNLNLKILMWIDLGFTIPLKVFKYKIQHKRGVAKTTK